MKKQDLSLIILKHLKKTYLSGETVCINDLFIEKNVPIMDAKQSLSELKNHTYIELAQEPQLWGGRNNNEDMNYYTHKVFAKLTESGNNYLKSFRADIKANIAIIISSIAALAAVFALFKKSC